jgi:N-carbamoyl-L-amino-acid hydrolase
VTPNAANVIPGQAVLSIELRDLSEARLTAIAEAIQARARSIAKDTRTTIEIVATGHYGSALAAKEVQSAVERAADGLGGVSHSPKELTPWEDCARGADVLLHTVLAMDRT